MKKILVPTDFSVESRNAYEVALAVARRTGAEILLLHAVDMPYNSAFSSTGENVSPHGMEQVFMLHVLDRVKRDMKELIASFPQEGVRVTEVVDVDSLINKVKKTIKEEGVDLVVMGSKGASGLEEFLIGSNTEKVVRTATCPVLTVKHRHSNFEPAEIVVASDFKKEIGGAMMVFRRFQKLFGARLHLVYVNTPGGFEASKYLHERLENLARTYEMENYSINIYNDVTEEDGILHFAQDINADMIMMATHGRTGLAHLLSGSIAEDLVNHANKPVLTFHLH